MVDPAPPATHPPTLTYRAVVIGIASMIGLAMWVQFHEILSGSWTILAENSPPAGAVGVFVGVLLIGSLVAWLRPRARLSTGELIVIYAMLVTSAPIMSQGMWHRFLGFVVAIPENKPNYPLVDSYSEKLWPHGEHLVANRRFAAGMGANVTVAPAGNARIVQAARSPVGAVAALELFNSAPAGDAETPVTTLRVRLPRRDAGGRPLLVPGERYYFNALFRLAGFPSTSMLTVELVADGGEIVPLLSLRRNTQEKYSSPGAFVRTGEPMVAIPRALTEYAELVFRLEGEGRAAVTDITFFSNESLARLHKGSLEVRAGDLSRVPDNQRDKLLVRPDRLASPAGVWYALQGYIPYRQWARPMAYWLSIVMAIFTALLGLSVIFRRQWADNERFSFPLVVLPRLLLEEREDGRRVIRPLFRHRWFQVGVAAAAGICLLEGAAFYIPGIPDPAVKLDMAEYFHSPAMKALMKGMGGSTLEINLMFVAIAFFIDLDMLLSIVIFFWLSKVPFYFGEVFGWKNLRGPLDGFPFPHEQHIGAFLGLAVIVLWISRKHLLGVLRRIAGLPGGVDDSGEAFSYRTAAIMIAVSFVFFAFWGAATGLGAVNALIFFGFLVVCGLSASRIRTEVGAPATYFTPYYPYLIFFLLGGLKIFGTGTMVLAFFAGGFMAVAQFLMFAPTQVEMLHLGNQFNARPRGISWALILGIVGGVLLGGYVMLVWAYGRGGDNIDYIKRWAMHQDWYLRSLRHAVAEADARSLAAATQGAGAVAGAYPTGPMLAVLFGLGLTVLLTFLRMHFVGFWLHPIGYVLGNAHFAYMCWASLFVAWAIKFVTLKVGGPRLIREQMTPLFAGVFCGGLLGIAFWDIVAVVAMSQGVRDVFGCFP